MKKERQSQDRRQIDDRSAAPQRNEYYESISAGLGILQVVLYLSLFTFVVLSFFRNTELITYRNFYYFFKDLNASAETVDVFDADSVSYPTASEQSFALYRKGLAVAGNDSLTVFTATGRQTLSQTLQYRAPVAVGTGKYLLVYEQGGTKYSVYNSYTRLYTGVSDYPIYGATVSDAGSFALISRSEQYNSVVSLYSNNFALINRYNRNGYVTCAALNEKGTRLALLTSTVSGGLFSTTLTMHVPKEDGEGTVAKLGTSIGLSCAFTKSGEVSALLGDGLYFISEKGELKGSYPFSGSEIVCAELSEDGASVVLQDTPISQKNQIILFDKNANMLYNKETDGAVTQISRVGNVVYLVCADGIDRLELQHDRSTRYACVTDGRKLLAIDENEVLFCSPQKAEYLRFTS